MSDFSLVLGGPLYQLFLRARLARPPLNLLSRRLITFPLLTWFIPLLLCLWDGTLITGTAVPFARDILTHTRFLVALPLFLLAEVIVHQRGTPLIEQFLHRKIIPPANLPQFKAAINSAMRWRNSLVMELLLVVISFTAGHQLWLKYSSFKTATWYASLTPEGPVLTHAGFWYAWISMPVFQFISLRWYYRLVLWARLLWQISRLPLRLIVTHPDMAGGLGFLSFTGEAFMPIVVAQGALTAGLLGGRILFEGAALTDFKIELLSVVIFQLIIILGPLCAFALPLHETRRRGLGRFGVLAMKYVDAFDRKWDPEQPNVGENILGSSDIQSLADIGNSFQTAAHIRLLPFGKMAVLQIIAMTLLPIVPFVLTVMPMDLLIGKVLKIIF